MIAIGPDKEPVEVDFKFPTAVRKRLPDAVAIEKEINLSVRAFDEIGPRKANIARKALETLLAHITEMITLESVKDTLATEDLRSKTLELNFKAQKLTEIMITEQEIALQSYTNLNGSLAKSTSSALSSLNKITGPDKDRACRRVSGCSQYGSIRADNCAILLRELQDLHEKMIDFTPNTNWSRDTLKHKLEYMAMKIQSGIGTDPHHVPPPPELTSRLPSVASRRSTSQRPSHFN